MVAAISAGAQASEHGDQRDEQAVSALNSMSIHLAGLKSFAVTEPDAETEAEFEE
jgi:protein-tyrosine-phosphatase